MRRSFVVWKLWLTGVVAMVTVDQPPVLPAALGQDVVLPCSVRVSPEDRQTELPVLYWIFTPQNPVQVWFPSEAYRDRMALLDPGRYRLNNSLRLRGVRWSDGGPYLCKLTVTTPTRGSFRTRGNQTTLVVYDQLVLVLVQSGPGGSGLRCSVNVSHSASFSLSFLHQGEPLDPGAPDPDPDPDPVGGPRSRVRLSQTAALQGPGLYKCRLLLQGGDVVQTRVHLHPPEEPWFLYGSLLMVPVASLLLLPCVHLLP